MAERIVDSQLGDHLDAAIVTSGLGYTDVAKQLGIEVRTLQHWRNGTRGVKADAIRKLCEILDVTPNFLLFGAEGLTFAEIKNQPKINQLSQLHQRLARLTREFMDQAR